MFTFYVKGAKFSQQQELAYAAHMLKQVPLVSNPEPPSQRAAIQQAIRSRSVRPNKPSTNQNQPRGCQVRPTLPHHYTFHDIPVVCEYSAGCSYVDVHTLVKQG